jgi:hypothetical protein
MRWVAFTLLACRVMLTWETVYSSKSPDATAELLVQRSNCFADCLIRVVVNQGWQSEEIERRSDCVVMFAHAAWRSDVVAIFIDGLYCGPIKVAFNTKTRRVIGFETSEHWLRASIEESYAVSADELRSNGGDVFKWATYPGDGRVRRSSEEFRRRTAR